MGKNLWWREISWGKSTGENSPGGAEMSIFSASEGGTPPSSPSRENPRYQYGECKVELDWLTCSSKYIILLR